MENNFKNKLYWLYLIGFFLILALPLLAVAPMFHPPAWGKTIIFRIILSILIFFFIGEILFSKINSFSAIVQNLLHRKSKIFWPFWSLIALFLVFLLATIFSLEPRFSFWGSPYRGGGFINFAFYVFWALLAFFIIKTKDWQKIWDFSIGVGAFVAVLGIFQKFELFNKYFVSYTYRPLSTMGGTMFLALYLLILTFPCFVFVLTNKNKKRFFYLSSLILFLFVILLTATRSAFLGLATGFLFFGLAFPNYQKSKKIKWLKISFALFLLISSFSVFSFRSYPNLIQKLEKNKVFGVTFSRTWAIVQNLSIEEIARSRGSGWFIAFNALKERPILGYGPENFSIAFDRNYNSNLPGVTKLPGGAGSSGWWDRAHNFVFDISVSAGIPALIIYLSLFWFLFLQLSKFKNLSLKQEENEKQKKYFSNNIIIAHGLQATFIGYLTANFFNFNVFSTYLVLFLLIAYSLNLINKSGLFSKTFDNEQNKKQKFVKKSLWKYLFLFILFWLGFWFIWQENLKPLYINSEINKAMLSKGKNQCQKAIDKMENIIKKKTYIDNYLRLQYIDILSDCIKKHPKDMAGIAQRALQILEEATKIRPTYTRSWMYYGVYTDKLIEAQPNINPKIREQITKKAYPFFKKALQLSPNRPEILIAWGKLDLTNRDYKSAQKRGDECIKIAPREGRCYWLKALSFLSREKNEKAADYMEMASQVGDFKKESVIAISELIKVYSYLAKKTKKIKYYKTLADLYEKLLELEPEKFQFRNFQSHASLAFIYSKLGKYDQARKEAEIVLKLSPASKKSVEAFLKTLPR